MIKPPLGSIKDRNGMDLTEAEDIKIDIKERWQEYTEELYKNLHNPAPSHQGYGFSNSQVWIWVGLKRKLSTEELMLLDCGIGEDSWESLGLQGDPTSPSKRRSVLSVHWKDWCWSWSSNTLATWCEELTHWKKTLMLRKIEGGRRRGQQRMRWLDGITDSMEMNLSKL